MRSPTHDRRNLLIELLRQDPVVSTRSLVGRLGVSPLTIRRDLDALERQGIVERLHGGARLLQTAAQEREERQAPFNVRCRTAPNEKRAIARAALQLIEKDQVIALDSGTTCLYFARAIPDGVPLTVITHSAYLPVELAGRPGFQVICTGGVLQWPSLCYVGSEAKTILRRFHVQRAVLGAQGVTLNVGCTDNINLLEIELKTIMVEQAEETIILADSSKLGRVALASFASLQQVRTLITDENADPAILQAIRNAGVEVIVAPLSPG